MKLRVYLSGAIVGSYRAQNIIKVLGDSRIIYSYSPSAYFRIDTGNRYVNKIINMLALLLLMPFRLVMIAMASHVVVLPMNSTLVSILDVILAKLFRKKVIVDYYISNLDTLVNDRAAFDERSLQAKWALFKDRFFLKFADSLIFLNKAESEYYQSVAAIKPNPEKMHIIPLCIDYRKELFQSDQEPENDEFCVCWWGTYIPLHGLENLITAFSKLKNERVKLFLFGNSDKKSEPYKTMVKELGLDDMVVIINDCSFSNGKLAPFLKEKCDLAVGNFGSSEKAKTVLVNKLVDSLSLGLPCLTMETRATRELLPANEGLILSEPNPPAIAESIKSAYKDRKRLKKVGESGKSRYFDTFSPDAFREKFLSLLHEGQEKP